MNNFVAVVLFFAVLLLLVQYYNNRRPVTAILLTTCVEPSSRQKKRLSVRRRKSLYMEKINLYLEHTNAMIFVVESTGYTFPIVHDRFRQFTFASQNETTYYSSSQAEADSILRAYESGMFDGYRRILKITGKYFIPDIVGVIENIPRCAGVVYQNGCKHAWQPSEIFGFDTKYTCSIFEPVYKSTETMERSLWNVHRRLGTEAYVLPPLGLGGRMIPRADGTILSQL
jgi:hypothetical protein